MGAHGPVLVLGDTGPSCGCIWAHSAPVSLLCVPPAHHQGSPARKGKPQGGEVTATLGLQAVALCTCCSLCQGSSTRSLKSASLIPFRGTGSDVTHSQPTHSQPFLITPLQLHLCLPASYVLYVSSQHSALVCFLRRNGRSKGGNFCPAHLRLQPKCPGQCPVPQ